MMSDDVKMGRVLMGDGSKNPTINVVYVINSIKKTGPNHILNTLAFGLDQARYNVSVVSFLVSEDDQTIKAFESAGIKYYSLNIKHKRIILSKGVKALVVLFQNIKPDIVHSHGILSDIAVRKAGKGASLVSTVHNDIFEDYYFSFGKIKGFLYSLWHILNLQKFSEVIFCSSSAHSANKRWIPHASYVRNGSDLPFASGREASAEIRKSLGISKKDTVFIYVGKLSDRKNVLELLRLFSISYSKNEHLLVIGDGELRKQCLNYQNNNIHLLSFRDNVSDFLAVADIYVSASKAEGLSVSIVEALCAGLLLLLSDIPSHREVIEIDDSLYVGDLFSEYDFGIVKNDVTKHLNLERQSKKYHELYLSSEIMVRSYEKIYRRLQN